MQSSHYISSQALEQDKISKLNFKLKQWRTLAFIFFFIALFLFTGLFLIISSRSELNVNSFKQVTKIQQACTNFLFNNTNLTEFSWKLEYNSSKQSQSILQEQSTKVISLNLSSNLLKTFCNNSLPDLQKLKLYENKIFTNYYYDVVSHNKFPKLKNLTIPRVGQFSNNYLPQLVNFQQNNFFFVDYFDNNFMPTLNGSRNFYYTKSMTGNTLGLQDLRSDVQNGFRFQNNTFLELKSFQIYCWGQMDIMPASRIINNSFPKLQSLVLDCNILDFNQSKKFKMLKALYFKSTVIEQFNNNVYPELKYLSIQIWDLKKFINNHLPLLEQLSLKSAQLTNFCDGNNYMPKLKKIQLYNSENIKSVDCLKESQQLEDISINYLFAHMENFYLPKLKKLYLSMQSTRKFSNNSFPSIERVIIGQLRLLTSFKKDNITFGNSLSNLYIDNSGLQELIFDTVMSNLTKLYITNSNLTSLNCTTFKNIKELILSANKLKDDVIDTLIDCNFTNPSYIYIQDNLISDKAKGRGKLASKYPNCYISL